MSFPAVGLFRIFPTPLGWMALLARDELVCGLRVGRADRPAALQAVRAMAEDAGYELDGLRQDVGSDSWAAQLAQRLVGYLAGIDDDFLDVAIDTSHRTPFQRRVVDGCRQIAYGQTLSYGELASQAGAAGAARAVGNVMAANRVPILVPCHRVVAAGGRLGGYSAPGGRRVKQQLLDLESGVAGGRFDRATGAIV